MSAHAIFIFDLYFNWRQGHVALWNMKEIDEPGQFVTVTAVVYSDYNQ